ncbi:MAG: hypothetical protein IPL27_03555 [Lewinellaceae bacterium]|nr:hypothetical protein [Lewinellaceae bacterium]
MRKRGWLSKMKVKPIRESSVASILELVQNAAAREGTRGLFIRKGCAGSIRRSWSPLAVLLVVVPCCGAGLFFRDWLYRASVFLVISAPAHWSSIFRWAISAASGGIAAGIRILFKGSNFLDLMIRGEHGGDGQSRNADAWRF